MNEQHNNEIKRFPATKAMYAQRLLQSSVLLACFLAVCWAGCRPSSGTSEIPAQDTSAMAPAVPDTTAEKAPPSTGTAPSPAPSGKSSGKAAVSPEKTLFAKYFEPYRDPAMKPSDRAESDPEEAFKAAYWSGDYKKTILAYDQLADKVALKEMNRFCYATALMASGRMKEARSPLAQLLDKGSSLYAHEARYMVGLIEVREGNWAAAREQLTTYRDQRTSRNREKAIELLAELDRQ